MTHAEAAAGRDGLASTPNYGPGGQAPIRWDLWYLKQGDAMMALIEKSCVR